MTPLRQFKYLRMLFGLTNAPHVFQHFVHVVFEPLIRGNKSVEIRNIETTTGMNEKLVPKFKGLYVVKKELDHNRYVVADID